MTAADETLRVLAAVEAAWTGDAAALEALAVTGPGERPLPEAIAAFAETTMQTLLGVAAGVHEGSSPAEVEAAVERLCGEVGTRMTKVWVQTLARWAASPGPRTAEDLCHVLISGILAFTGDGTEADVLPLLAQLRAATLAQGR
ncbi:hypothetical protein P3T27_006869 [Kitasatospora sp. MAA19]|uniref:hypothetical protein n=1 Tax=Kitasatospora sp. MAA19 TaxID=3035090 RepID=UPI00247312E7|nr:hypothetical protein [Kitasatospora sp. MAA19]MDH6710120.1 hypothetical protein [Kitasatospora sp. MAA19]